jgi:serine/threonine protein phosphatase PrpC
MNIHYTSTKGRRDANEDRHTIKLNINKTDSSYNDINLFGIYDGHGGCDISDYLSNNIEKFYCLPELQVPFLEEYHKKVFSILQEQILGLKYKKGFKCGSTCLLNIMYRYKSCIYFNIVNLGDSRLVVVYRSGISKQITTDHKPEDTIEKTRIQKMGGTIYTDTEGTCRVGNLSLARAFGDGDNAPFISHMPDIHEFKLTPSIQFIVMACDGLWDVINNNELYALLIKHKKNQNLGAVLAEEALRRGSTDNISVIVLEMH